MDHLNSSEFITTLSELNLSEQNQPKRNQNHSDKVSKGADIVLSEDSLTRGGISDAVKEEILELVRNEVERILINRTSLISSDSKYPIAPQAPLIGKKLSGERVKLGVTIDKILNQLMVDAAKELRQPYGQVIDNALWLYFGKPLLSFQKDSDG